MMNNKEISRRERKKRATRSKILSCARRLFEKNGYEETSIEEITELSDVSKGTFFNYFSSKESLLFGIAEEEVADIFDMMEDTSFLVSNTLEKIESILERLLIDSIPYLHLTGRVVFMTIISNQKEKSPFSRIRKVLEELIVEAQSLGVIKKDNSKEDIATTLMGTYYGVIFKWFEEGGSPGTVEELRRALKVIFDGIIVM